MGHDSQKYWRDQDGGIHVFAVARYSLMKSQQFGRNADSFPIFLKRMFREGKFSKGQIEQLNRTFFVSPASNP